MTTNFYANVTAKGNAPMPEVPYMEARLAHLTSVGLGLGPTADSFRDLLTVAYIERDLAAVEALCEFCEEPAVKGTRGLCGPCYADSLCPVCGDDNDGCRFHGCERGEDLSRFEPDEDWTRNLDEGGR